MRGKLEEADALFELVSGVDEDEDEDWESPDDSDPSATSNAAAQTGQSPSPEKTPSVQARYLSGLVDRVVMDGKLLLSEAGQAFSYQEDGGYYKPVTNLEAHLANALPSKTTRSLLSRHLREIAERLTWEKTICCDLDGYNDNPNLVNLENGVFSIASSGPTEKVV